METHQYSLTSVLGSLLARQEISAPQMRGVMNDLMNGSLGEAEAAAFLMGLRMKGETAEELAAAASVLREHMLAWDPGRPGVLDTCGTGGDGAGTFNISTAAALVAAACGVPVVKHGNRSVSSRCGSADFLAALGVRIEGDAQFARQCLDRAGFAFCFAPRFHPAMRHVGPVRKKLGIPTLFNCLGPLANPAGAPHQLLGVGRPELLDLLADTLARLGTKHALVIHSEDGLDEISLAAPTQVREVQGSTVRSLVWTAEDFGLERCQRKDLLAEGVDASCAVIKSVLAGQEGAAFRVVLANAAAALVAAEQVAHPREGVARAAATIRSGKAGKVLENLQELSRFASV